MTVSHRVTEDDVDLANAARRVVSVDKYARFSYSQPQLLLERVGLCGRMHHTFEGVSVATPTQARAHRHNTDTDTDTDTGRQIDRRTDGLTERQTDTEHEQSHPLAGGGVEVQWQLNAVETVGTVGCERRPRMPKAPATNRA